MSEKLISLFYENLNRLEKKNCLACFHDSNSQKGHTCFYLYRSIDGNETKFLFANYVLEELIQSGSITFEEYYQLEEWLKQQLTDLRIKKDQFY